MHPKTVAVCVPTREVFRGPCGVSHRSGRDESVRPVHPRARATGVARDREHCAAHHLASSGRSGAPSPIAWGATLTLQRARATPEQVPGPCKPQLRIGPVPMARHDRRRTAAPRPGRSGALPHTHRVVDDTRYEPVHHAQMLGDSAPSDAVVRGRASAISAPTLHARCPAPILRRHSGEWSSG